MNWKLGWFNLIFASKLNLYFWDCLKPTRPQESQKRSIYFKNYYTIALFTLRSWGQRLDFIKQEFSQKSFIEVNFLMFDTRFKYKIFIWLIMMYVQQYKCFNSFLFPYVKSQWDIFKSFHFCFVIKSFWGPFRTGFPRLSNVLFY